MADQRTYQGHVYQQAAPGQPWVLVGPAQSAGPQPVTIGTPDPHRANEEQRSASADARAAAAAQRSALEWNATHEPDGSPKAVDGALTPEAIIFNAQQYLATGQMPTLGMGKQAAADREAILNEAAKQAGAAGLHGPDLARQIAHYKAGSKALGVLETQHATIGQSEQTALLNGQQLIDRSGDLPGQTRFAPVNSVVQWYERNTGNTDISAHDAAWQTFTTEYAKVVAGSPSGAGTLSDSARREAQDTLRGNARLEQKKSAFEQMKRDMANRMASIENGINSAYTHLTEKPGYTVPSTTADLAPPPAADDKRKDPVTGLVTVGNGQAGAGGGGGNTPGGTPMTPWDDSAYSGSVAATDGSGGTRTVQHPEIRAMVASMLNAGSGVDAINAELARRNASQITPEQYATAKSWMAAHPGKAYPISATQEVPLTTMQKAVDSPLASFGVQATNSFEAGIPGALTGDRGRGTLEAMNASHPVASLLGDIVGSTAGMAAAGAGAAKLAGKVASPTVSALLANPAIADMAFGATSGATQSEDPYKGAIIGALTAGAGGAAGRFIGKSAPILTGVRSPSDPLSGGERAVFKAANRTGVDDVAQALAKADQLGVPAALADVSNDVNSLTGAALRRSPTAGGDARAMLGDRGRGQYDRFLGAVERDLGPIENVPQRSEDLITQAKTAAGPLYDQAYRNDGAGVFYNEVKDMMGRPSMQAALGKARQIAAEEGRDPNALGLVLGKDGLLVKVDKPTWQTWDYVKRGMDDVVEGYRDKTSGKLVLDTQGRAINDTLRSFLGKIDVANPDYAAARAAYAGPASERAAMARGQEALRMSPNQLGVNVSKASPSQVDQMRLGFQSQLADNAGGYKNSTNPFDAVLGTPAMEQRLSSLYPSNQDGVARLLAQRDLERQLAGSSNRLVGNSMTAERHVADAAFDHPNVLGDVAQGAVESLASGGLPIATVGRLSVKHGLSALRDYRELGAIRGATALADEIAPVALNTDPAAAAAKLTDMAQRDAQFRAVLEGLLKEAGNRGSRVGAGASVGVADALMR